MAFYVELDGDQSVEFYWIDPVLSAERIAARTKYNGHLYYPFEPEESWDRPGVRAFGRVNGGVIFEACYFLDTGSVPLLSVFYADKSHLRDWSHHPIYRKFLQYSVYYVYSTYSAFDAYFVFFKNFFVSESLMNIHEDMRAKPSSWTVLGWLPIIDEEKSLRPTQGYQCDSARNVRLHHQCWNLFLQTWPDIEDPARVIMYGDGKARLTRHHLGACIGDVQVRILFLMHFSLIGYILRI